MEDTPGTVKFNQCASLLLRHALDIRHHFSYKPTNQISPERTRPAGIAGRRGEVGARGRSCDPLPGGPGIMPAGTVTGARGASLEVGGWRRAEPVARPVPRSLARVAPWG